jgi:hypothetical protein
MTVKELKKLLRNVPDDAIVVMSQDSEGNDYSPLANVEKLYYKEETSWRGEVFGTKEKDTVPAVVLWPTN